MHSILGLAASELIASDPSLAEAAMVHRLKSIQAIKRKLAASDSGITYAEGNALIATCFALTFQSVILEDGSKQLPRDKSPPLNRKEFSALVHHFVGTYLGVLKTWGLFLKANH